MSEQIPKIEKQDVQAPAIQPDGTAIVLQRHELYDRNRESEIAGSIFPESADQAMDRDIQFFEDVLAQETDGSETMFLFVSSDTQYAGKGRRSLETARVAQDALIAVLDKAGIDPTGRIINLNPDFETQRHEETDQDIRPIKHLREPQIFDGDTGYLEHLRDTYGAADSSGQGLSQAAWAAHESDAEREVREQFGAEGVHDIVARTKRSVAIFRRYSELFHDAHPNKRMVIWAASHYDTISPLVKDATDTSFDDYVPVDYGGGVVMTIEPGSKEVTLSAQNQSIVLDLGQKAIAKVQQ